MRSPGTGNPGARPPLQARMIERFILTELAIWASLIALLPIALAFGVATLRSQTDREVRERLRAPVRPAAVNPRVLGWRRRRPRVAGTAVARAA